MLFLILLISCLFALCLTPLCKYLSYKLRILDSPNHRKIHAKPIPLLGGLAIFLSFSLGLLITGTFNREILCLIIFGVAFIVLGFFDDAGIKIRARYKIWSHLVFAFVFIYLTGIFFNLVAINWLNWLLTACFITFMTNSTNMLDGMDGLVSGLAFWASLFLALLAYNNNLPHIAMLCLALAGATLGFLKYNFNPASIFLGEGGATLIGFLLAVIAIKLKVYQLWNVALLLGIPRLQFISFIVPLIILAIPIFDTCFVFTNRFINHIKMSTPGKDHSHHRIHLMGLSQKATVLTLYSVQIVLGAIALTIANSDLQQFLSLLLILIVMAFVAWNFLLRVKVYS
ncbi:hypothetical protein COT42_07450 [Candidatus Saganbacteria bacterium CG08_land_8_20_14_0_20_45_16]|uniref:Undecaprenyl-phosphate alpha-N-acetylglucosaminyl 1-phosphate transferase n=1 Tax=Candidatus Saganbacteria bacterium CG08_land_8_20_14_0_20_45_16 TaxID=2014293 RepID=A0A2H0XUL0_UNCSA|nr:MAG: hypothetical protein COT42_07450 [Candidatus Saganbacteria bacterium CG08_land_8_20_14_0_20_45_16]